MNKFYSLILGLTQERFCRVNIFKEKKIRKSVLNRVKVFGGCQDMSGGLRKFRKKFDKKMKFWIFRYY